jgi:predicted negative regulator of RcsB-dependent stress response
MTTHGLEPLLALVLFLPVMYVSIFVHELGHALIGRAVGFAVNSFGIGTGRPFLTFSVRGVRIFFCGTRPLQGLTFCWIPHLSPPRWRMVAFFAAGILANSLVAVAAVILWSSHVWGEPLWVGVTLINGIFAITNLIPIERKVGKAILRSDARLVLLTLRRRPIAMPAPVVIQFVRALRGLWESIEDHRTLRANLAASAVSWADLGDPERATALFTEAQALPRNESSAYVARESLVRAAIEIEAGRLDEASSALDEAESMYREKADELALLHVALGRARVLILRGEAPGALVHLDTIAANPLVHRHSPLRIESLVARLSAALAISDISAAKESFAQYQTARREQPSASRDLRVYRAVAQFFTQRGDSRNAAPSFQAAAVAIDEIAAAWNDPADRAEFLHRQSGFLTEAGNCLRAINKPQDAERLVEPLLSFEAFERKMAEVPRERNHRRFRIGLRLILADVLCSVVFIIAMGAVGVYLGPGRTPPMLFLLLVFGFAAFTIFTVAYLVFHVTIGRLIPPLRRREGAVILALACLPWMALIIAPLMSLLSLSH